MIKFVFCQISTQLINKDLPDDIAAEYYRKQWDKPGYYKPEHFWEIPLWIVEIMGSLKHTELMYEAGLCIITEHNQTLPDGDYYLFSVLDVNKTIVSNIIVSNFDKQFVIGGYTDIIGLQKCPNVTYYKSVKSFISKFGCYVYDLDYSLFAGTQTIPRLTMSTGCKHHCRFCTVPDELCEYSTSQILRQLESFSVLDFRYVYLNDKTFGQASNYWRLKECRAQIRSYNPNFAGFIVQTTADKCKNPAFVAELEAMGVLIVELGVETYNNDILKAYHKPQNTETIDRAVDNLYAKHLAIIPNIIIGLDGENEETYQNTYDFILDNWHRLYMLNIYNLARYDTDGGDKNELTQTGTNVDKQFYNDVFALGIDILKR